MSNQIAQVKKNLVDDKPYLLQKYSENPDELSSKIFTISEILLSSVRDQTKIKYAIYPKVFTKSFLREKYAFFMNCCIENITHELGKEVNIVLINESKANSSYAGPRYKQCFKVISSKGTVKTANGYFQNNFLSLVWED